MLILKIFFVLVLFGSIIGYLLTKIPADKKPESIAFTDYLKNKGKTQDTKSKDAGMVSNRSLPIYTLLPNEDILSYKGKRITDLLTTHEETLWFVMKQTELEGIVVTADNVPVKIGGKNRSKELLKIYKNAKSTLKPGELLKFFEIEEQGLFVVVRDDNEDIYLGKRACQLLNLPVIPKIAAAKLITKLKDRISNARFAD